MMAGTGDDMGGFKGLEGDAQLSSHQDLTQVGPDCGVTKIDFVDRKGIGNVTDDVGGSYIFVGEGDGGDPGGDVNCNVEVKDGVDVKDDGVVEVETGGVVAGIGGNGTVEENDCGLLAVTAKGVALHTQLFAESGSGVVVNGQPHCEVKAEDQLGLKDESAVGVENGEVVVGAGDVKVEDHADLKDESVAEVENGELVVGAGNVKVEDQADLKDETVAGVGNEKVVVGAGGSDQDYVVEDNNCGMSVVMDTDMEDGHGEPVKAEDQVDFQSTTKPIENREFETDTDTEFGKRQEDVIESVLACKLSENNVKSLEQNVVLSSAELRENKTSQDVVLGAADCELAKVLGGIEFDVGEGQIKQTEVKLVEKSLETQISVTSCAVDCVSYELGEDQAILKQINDLANDGEPGESKEAVLKSAEADDDICVKALQQDVIVSPANQESDTVVLDDADGAKVETGIGGIEAGVVDRKYGQESDTVVLDADGAKVETGIGGIEAGVVDRKYGQESDTVVLDAGGANGAEVEAAIEAGVVDQTELESLEDSLRSQIRFTESVDCLSHELQEDSKKLTREYIDKSQSVNQLYSTSSNAGTMCLVEKMPIKCGESIIAGTADGATVELEPSANLESDRSHMSEELGGNVPTEISGSYLVSIDAGTVSDQVPEDADVKVGLVQGCKAGVVQVTNGDGTITEISTLQTNLEEHIGGCAISLELNGNPDDAESNSMLIQAQSHGSFQSDSNGGAVEPKGGNLVYPITGKKSELEAKNLDMEDAESGLLSATIETKSEIGGPNRLSSCLPNDAISEMKIEFGTFDSAELVSKSGHVDVPSISQISNGDIEKSWKANSTINLVGSESYADMNSISGIQYCSDMAAKDATVVDSKVPSGSANVGSAPLLECSSGDSVNEQNLGVVAKAKPFQFLVKFPRFEDDKLRELIKDAQLLVEEKTFRRDDIRSEIEMKRTKLQSIKYKIDTTKTDERAARRLVKLKRQEIDSIQDGINRVKNSISVIDITNRITHMENMIEHETNPLNEEKQLLREINTLRKLRDQISSNVCPAEEVSLAVSQIEPMEMQLKTLKRELGDLKAKVSSAEAAIVLLGKEYSGESKSIRELQAQFRAANDVRQDAYKDLLGLKKQLHDKSKQYWMYKDEVKVANDYALAGDREALYRLCANQVEAFMDLWNKNDEFREDYIRCNTRSTLKRFKTSDGRSLGPDEEAPVIPIFVGEREDMQLSTPSRATYPSPATNLKQKITVKPVKSEQVDGEYLVVAEPKDKMLKDKASVKPIDGTESVLHIVSGHLESVETKEEEIQQTEEELELARQAELLREQEIAARLKEKLRQEERVKAQEALERKKRNAEKAQMRAMIRAQKEAEQKEKEREKRLRKKEKKNADGETGLELQTDSTKVKEESLDSPATKLKKSSQVNKYIKPKAAAIPPALRNKGKRHLKQVMWWILGGVAMVLLFMLVNSSGSSRRQGPRTKGDRFSGNHWQPI